MNGDARTSHFVMLLLAAIAGSVFLALISFAGRHHGWGAILWCAAVVAACARISYIAYARRNTAAYANEILLPSAVVLVGMPIPFFHLVTAIFSLAGAPLPYWAMFVGALLQIMVLGPLWGKADR